MTKPGKENKKRGQGNNSLSTAQISEILGRNKLKNLFVNVDVSSVVFFRIIFGTLMLIDVIRYMDKIHRYWIEPQYHFSYLPFDFIHPLPENGMYILFGLMLILSVFIILGLFYRASMILFFISFTYVFLLEQARYLNHFYLISLVSFVMIFIPANSTASIDRRIFKNIHSETCEAWSLWLLRFMIALPYFFGGIAKLNSDWLQGEPFGMWFTNNINPPFFSDLFKQRETILFISYSSMLFDLLIIPALLYKRTRTAGFIIAIIFHLINSQWFNIGIFPWFMIAATTLFFEPDWPRNFVNFLFKNKHKWEIILPSKEKTSTPGVLTLRQKRIKTLLVTWFIIMIFLPLRHLFIEGNANWTEEGQKFSWLMKLRTKKEIASFTAKDKKTGNVIPINVFDYLKPWQKNIMQNKPNLIWQFCQIVKKDFKKKGIDVVVYANIKASLNGRKFQQLTDSTVDLASVPFDYFSHSKWILPLEIPLNDRLNETNEGESNNAVE